MSVGDYIPLPENARALLQRWVEYPPSSAVILEGLRTQRSLIQDASTEIVQIVRATNIPILYLVDVMGSGRSRCLSSIETLDLLTIQAIKQNTNLQNERSFSAMIARVRDAVDFEARVSVLASALEGLSGVYILVNLFTAQSCPQVLSLLDGSVGNMLSSLAVQENFQNPFRIPQVSDFETLRVFVLKRSDSDDLD